MSDVILVAGGAGFIGCHFVRHALAQTRARVVVIDKLTYAGNLASLADVAQHPRFTFLKGDIARRDDVAAAFEAHAPTRVVNFAAETNVDRSIDDPRAFVESNLIGAFELLEASRRRHASLAKRDRASFRFLQVSTDEVYGSLGPAGVFSEDTSYAPNSPYAATKAGADHLVRAYHVTFGLPTLVTNCSNNYGPYQYPEKLVPLTLMNALDGEALPIYGDGGNVRDWLFVEDHCEGILDVLERGRVGEKYNIGGSNEKTNLELVDTLCAALERHSPAKANSALAAKNIGSYAELKTFVPDRPGHDRRYAIDSTKIRNELAWRPAHDLERGLEKTVRWYLENRAWCELVQSAQQRRMRLGLSRDDRADQG